MAATFGNLNLEELGVVGTPEVQYAAFETEVSQPRGYDGGVLANFRRGATSIKFNLTLGGTRDEMHNKINALAAELYKGQQELILPTMTPGFHFNASANCILQPAEHIDGFILPLEFAVPYGLAERETIYSFTRPNTYSDYTATVTNDGTSPAPYYIYGEVSAKTNIENQFIPLRFSADNVTKTAAAYGRYGQDTPAGRIFFDVEAAAASIDDYYLSVSFRSGNSYTTTKDVFIPIGETEVRLQQFTVLSQSEVEGLSFVVKEGAIW